MTTQDAGATDTGTDEGEVEQGDDGDDDEVDLGVGGHSALPGVETAEEQARADGQTACATWYPNAMRMLLSPAEMEVVFFLTLTHLSQLRRADGGDLPPQVALVATTATAVRARLWPSAPPVPDPSRAPMLVFASKVPLTLDAVFALMIVEGGLRFAGSHAEWRLALVGQAHGPTEAERPAIQAELQRWTELLTGYAETTARVREESGVSHMGMAPLSDIEARFPPAPAAPKP